MSTIKIAVDMAAQSSLRITHLQMPSHLWNIKASHGFPLLPSSCAGRPSTGRTHQIRVHLQHLGHPIANDQQYGGTYRGPETPSQAAVSSQQRGPAEGDAPFSATATAAGAASGSGEQPADASGTRAGQAAAAGETLEALQQSSWDAAREQPAHESKKEADLLEVLQVEPGDEDRLCVHCPYLPPVGYPLSLRPLWLHACRCS